VAPNEGERLDIFVTHASESEDMDASVYLSRSQIKRLIKQGHIRVNGGSSRPSYRLRLDDEIQIHLPPLKPLGLEPEKMDLDILYEDADLITINKPPGLVVHPGAGHFTQTLVHGLLAHCQDLSGVGGVQRPGIVHRLDAGTSGVIVVAKHDRCHAHLSQQFAQRKVHKKYEAFVVGVPSFSHKQIHTPYGRHPNNRKLFSSKVSSGKEAVSDLNCIFKGGGMTLVEVTIQTGRTHQIRVHLADAGFPIAGDTTYGKRQWQKHITDTALKECVSQLPSQALHARELEIEHPSSGERLLFQAKRPQLLESLHTLLQKMQT
jgi:23S rRNA pseudouridine1911/1915/1917 synthase